MATKSMPFRERNSFARRQLLHPGCVNSTNRSACVSVFIFMLVPPLLGVASQCAALRAGAAAAAAATGMRMA
jgi:hypothetical protein